MQFLIQKHHSSYNVDKSSSCCSAQSMDDYKEQKRHFRIRDFLSGHSQHTEATGALSVDSSFDSGSVDSHPTRPATSPHCIIKSALKRKRSSPCIIKERRITFAHNIVSQTGLGRHEFSDDELKACWLRGDEYTLITKSCLNQIHKLEQGTHPRDQKYCTRGLETTTRLGGLGKAQNKRAAWEAVLAEQHEQIGLGVIDEGAIALVYQDVSSSCQLWAVKMALDDYRAAQVVYDDTLDEN